MAKFGLAELELEVTRKFLVFRLFWADVWIIDSCTNT